MRSLINSYAYHCMRCSGNYMLQNQHFYAWLSNFVKELSYLIIETRLFCLLEILYYWTEIKNFKGQNLFPV